MFAMDGENRGAGHKEESSHSRTLIVFGNHIGSCTIHVCI